MSTASILVAGFGAYQRELGIHCAAMGFPTALYHPYGEPEEALELEGIVDLREANRHFDVAIAALNGPVEEREVVVQELAEVLAEDGLLLVSCLGHGVTEIASWCAVPERVVGFALLPPIQEGALVELAAGLRTAPEALASAKALFKELGKEIEVVHDSPGLVLPRILAMLVNEAAFAVMEGVSTPEEIDRAMQLGTHYPHGPLEWGDRIGLDLIYDVLMGLQAELGEDRYRVCPTLRRLVLAGHVGVASGQGFYGYQDEEGHPSPVVIWSRE